MPEFQGDNLIFLISQPRAGSTMLQRILGGHPEVHAVSEPWIMLHPVYALRQEGVSAEFDSSLARGALEEFYRALPDGEADYVRAVRRMAGYLYGRALEGTGKSVFLDKTPRYYLILPELRRIFPRAKFIILLRNPLAVLRSIVDKTVWEPGAAWSALRERRHDLLDAPESLTQGAENWEDRSRIVRYEDIVTDPETEIRALCRHLDLQWAPRLVEYGRREQPRSDYGDQSGVETHGRPVQESLTRWEGHLSDVQFWRLCSDYLEFLGNELLARMGYSYSELRSVLDGSAPARNRRFFTRSLAWILRDHRAAQSQWERRIIWLRRLADRFGYRHVLRVILGSLGRSCNDGLPSITSRPGAEHTER
jgi:hypothetical protein